MFELTKDGSEIIQKITGKDSKGKYKKVKVADVVDNKVELVEGAKESTKTKPAQKMEEGLHEKLEKWVAERLAEDYTIEQLINEVVPNSKLSNSNKELVIDYLKAQMDNGKVTPAKEEVKRQAQPEEVMTKDKFKEEAVAQVKKIIKEKAGKPELYTKEEEQIIENAKDSGVLQQANKELIEEITPSKEYTGKLAEVRSKVDSIDKELSALLDGVKDMNVRQAVKEHFTKKLNEIKADKSRLDKLIDRLQTTLDNRAERKYGENTNLLKGIVASIDNLVRKMLNQLVRLRKMVKGLNKQYSSIEATMNELLKDIDNIENMSEPVKMTVGEVRTIDESVYGKPILEVDGKRVEAPKRIIEVGPKKGNLVAQSTAINDALEAVKLDKLSELRNELYSITNEEVEFEAIVEDKKVKQIEIMSTNKSSLSNKLIRGLLLNFPMNNAVHKIIKRGNDSVFGKLTGNPFANTNRLLDVLPKSFKEFFASDKESRKALKENIETMATY